MATHLIIIGILFILLALLHLFFPGYFNWKEELNKLQMINRQMMYIHTFFVALMLFLMGIFCLTTTSELLLTPLGRRISLGLGVFWTIRLIIQFFGYSTILWKGKSLETIIHVIFSICWFYFSIFFLAVFFTA